MSDTNLIVDNLFNNLTDSERNTLLEKATKDEMLPEKLQNPDSNHVARGFWIFMTRSKSADNWVPLDEIMRTLLINDITEDEVSITRYVISKYITNLNNPK